MMSFRFIQQYWMTSTSLWFRVETTFWTTTTFRSVASLRRSFKKESRVTTITGTRWGTDHMCINVVPEPYMYLNSSYWDRSNVILYYQLYHHYCVKESFACWNQYLYFICYHRVVEVTPERSYSRIKLRRRSPSYLMVCVWSTGVAPQDITKKLIAKLPQQRNA